MIVSSFVFIVYRPFQMHLHSPNRSISTLHSFHTRPTYAQRTYFAIGNGAWGRTGHMITTLMIKHMLTRLRKTHGQSTKHNVDWIKFQMCLKQVKFTTFYMQHDVRVREDISVQADVGLTIEIPKPSASRENSYSTIVSYQAFEQSKVYT